MTTDNNEQIDKFLWEQMSPKENEAFMRDLETNASLRKEAQLRALMIQELHDRRAEQDAAIIAEVLADKKGAARKARIIRLVKWVGSAAAVLVLFYGVYSALSHTGDERDYIAMADRYYSETPAPTLRSDLTDADKELADLFNQVGSSSDMPSVISRLQTIYDHLDSEYAYTANGNDVRIAWYLALAYLKDNQPDKAAGLLRTIIHDDKGTDLGGKAQELLNNMKEE